MEAEAQQPQRILTHAVINIYDVISQKRDVIAALLSCPFFPITKLRLHGGVGFALYKINEKEIEQCYMSGCIQCSDMSKFPELDLLRRSLAHREYEVMFVHNVDNTVIVLSKPKNVLDRTAFYEIEDCGFRFTEVRLDKDGHVKALFQRDKEEARCPNLR